MPSRKCCTGVTGLTCMDDCLYKCDGLPPCPTLCAFKITMPSPSSVPAASGPTCPPPDYDCPPDHPCNLCFYLFDGMIYVSSSIPNRRFIPCSGLVGNPPSFFWGGTSEPPDEGWNNSCDKWMFTLRPYQTVEDFAIDFAGFCWTSTELDCPECTEAIEQCSSSYIIFDIRLKCYIEYENGCSKTTVKMEYRIQKQCDTQMVPFPPFAINPETKYTHTFERTGQCSCNTIFGPMTYVSTEYEVNSRGELLPDPCNMDGAAIELVGVGEECGACGCWDCAQQADGTIILDLSGSGFDGSVAMTYYYSGLNPGPAFVGAASCIYVGEVETSNCGTIAAYLTVTCFSCDVVRLTLLLTAPGVDPILGGEYAYFSVDISTDCGDIPVSLPLAESSPGDCSLASYTVSVL